MKLSHKHFPARKLCFRLIVILEILAPWIGHSRLADIRRNAPPPNTSTSLLVRLARLLYLQHSTPNGPPQPPSTRGKPLDAKPDAHTKRPASDCRGPDCPVGGRYPRRRPGNRRSGRFVGPSMGHLRRECRPLPRRRHLLFPPPLQPAGQPVGRHPAISHPLARNAGAGLEGASKQPPRPHITW